jgi:hypothetical protein
MPGLEPGMQAAPSTIIRRMSALDARPCMTNCKR